MTSARGLVIIPIISIVRTISTIYSSVYKIISKKRYYERLEFDEFWTFVYCKKYKVWLIYAYDRAPSKTVIYVWHKRSLKMARKLKANLLQLKVSYDFSIDNWVSSITAFKNDYE